MVSKTSTDRRRRRVEFDYLPLDTIDVSISNVRKSNIEKNLDELVKSIREIGVQQPVKVCRKHQIENGKKYELIIGQRRYLASIKAGETTIPAIIDKVTDRTDALVKSFSENIHSLELDYRDKKQVATELLNKFGNIANVAKQLGVSSQTVRKYLRYAAVPEEMKEMVEEGRLGATTALEIVQKIEDEGKAVEIAKGIEELPRSAERGFVIDYIREDVHRSVKNAIKDAKIRSRMRTITIHVTKRVYDAVVEAAKRYGLEKEYVVRDAVEDWLTTKGFIE